MNSNAPTARLLKLLAGVLPSFADHAKAIASECTHGSKAWINHISIYTTLNDLAVSVEALKTRFRLRTWSVAEQECESSTRKLLQLLESWSSDDDQSSKRNTLVSVLAYPKLERIRDGQATAKSLERQSEQQCIEILASLSQYSLSLDRLCSRPQTSTSVEKRTESTPSWDLRDHLQRLHDVLKKFWNCQCQSSHEGMLFLATHRTDHDKRGGAEFKMLFGSSRSLAWNEAQVFVANPPRSTSSVQFEPNFRVPRRKNTIEHVCNIIHASKPNSRLNLIVNDGSLWQTPSRSCVLGIKNLTPSATFLDVLQGPILDFECKIVFAVIMAYNFLYLCGSSWFPCPWDKTAIKFLRSSHKFAFNEILRPLLAARYSECRSPDALPEGDTHDDQSRLALGVVLLEIFEQQSIEDLREHDDHAYDDQDCLTTDTNLHTANRVFENIQWDVHEDYASAVEACLDPADVDHSPWGDLEHCHFIYQRVIKPLESEMKAHCNISVDDLDQMIMGHRGTTAPATDPHVQASSELPVRDSPSMSFPETPGSDGSNPSQKKTLNAHHSTVDINQRISLATVSRQETLEQSGLGDLQSSRKNKSSDGITYTKFHTHVKPTLPGAVISQGVFMPLSLFHVQSSDGHLDGFADDWFTRMRDTVGEVAPHRRTSVEERVKIAILDSGVDDETFRKWPKKFKDRISYKTFVPGDTDQPQDDADHGTHTAALILRIAPNADVFIARISSGSCLQAADSIVKAVEYYTHTEKVDMISMSFGYPQLDEYLQLLQATLLRAHAENIVLFAAGHNSGALRKVSYPANQDHVICIGSCDGFGNSSPFNPSGIETQDMFCTLGEGIRFPHQADTSPSKSGTSFATPIATGIAAVLMDWIMRESRTWTAEERRHALKVKTRKGITNIFEKLSEIRDGKRIISPWNLFREESIGNAKGVLLDVLMNTQI